MDLTSSIVIKWLLYYGKDFIRFNNGDNLDIIKIEISNRTNTISFVLLDEMHTTAEFKSYWYRRGNFSTLQFHNFISSNIALANDVNSNLHKEKIAIIKFLHEIFESKRHIGSIANSEVNKLQVLKLAASIGLNIPETKILSRKEDLQFTIQKQGAIITKGIQDSPIILFKEEGSNLLKQFGSLTSEFKKTMIESVSKTFPLTKFQKKINKAFELRIFLFNNILYSMAIFSQNNIKTEIDFRNYDRNKPNRNVPFILPKDIEKKLHLLCRKLDLNSGSIDMVVDKNHRYYFLEINPIGQFGMVSHPCNYYLEKKIANYL